MWQSNLGRQLPRKFPFSCPWNPTQLFPFPASFSPPNHHLAYFCLPSSSDFPPSFPLTVSTLGRNESYGPGHWNQLDGGNPHGLSGRDVSFPIPIPHIISSTLPPGNPLVNPHIFPSPWFLLYLQTVLNLTWSQTGPDLRRSCSFQVGRGVKSIT